MCRAAQPEAFAQRILVRKVLAGERLIDHCHLRGVGRIAFVESAPLQDASADGVEEGRADAVPDRRKLAAGLVFQRHAGLPVIPRHRAVKRQAGIAHPGDLFKLPLHVAINGGDLFGRIAAEAGVHLGNHAALRLEPENLILQIAEGFHHQSRAGEQHQRNRRLQHHQRSLRQRGTAGGRTPRPAKGSRRIGA